MYKPDPTQNAREELTAFYSKGAPSSSTLVLDARSRGLSGVDMAPLLSGEFALLAFLGEKPFTWHSSHRLSICVYRRDDLAARQLVWKYASTLRKKLAPVTPGLIDLCRRRGYSCRAQVVVVNENGESSASLQLSPASTR